MAWMAAVTIVVIARWAAILALCVLGLGALYGAVVGLKFGVLRAKGARLLARTLATRPPASSRPGPARITFVCPVTRPKVLARYLDHLLSQQDYPAERLFYSNVGDRAMVAARLFNHLALQVETEFVAFCHQDWGPVDRDWIARTLEVFDRHPRCGMVAQIGVRLDRQGLGGRILDPHGFNGVEGSVRLHAPDEQCFVVRTAQVRELPFDEAHLPEFHYYAVDYAWELQARGFEIWSTPALAYHHSAAGALTSAGFKRAREVLRAKYGPGVVRATTGWI